MDGGTDQGRPGQGQESNAALREEKCSEEREKEK